MKVRFAILFIVLITVNSLHLHLYEFHETVTTTDLSIKAQIAKNELTGLATTLNSSMGALNPFHQEDRIEKM